MTPLRPPACFLCFVFLAGCASSGKLPEGVSADFRTRITDIGLKHFQLQLVRERGKPGVPDRMPRRMDGGPGGGKPERQAKNNRKVLVAQAEKLIEQNHFCRDGFWVLDENYYGGAPYLRGECNELATPADREAFPDTIERW